MKQRLILTVVSSLATVLAGVSAAICAKKFAEKKEQEEERLGRKLTKKETVKTALPYVLIPGLCVIVGVGASAMNYRRVEMDITNLTTTCIATEKAYSEYRKAAEHELGAEKANAIKNQVSKVVGNDMNNAEQLISDGATVNHWMDSLTMQDFYCSKNELDRYVNEINREVAADPFGTVSVGNLHNKLGIRLSDVIATDYAFTQTVPLEPFSPSVYDYDDLGRPILMFEYSCVRNDVR